MLDHDNMKEYADPGIYDLENKDFKPDDPFYKALAQRVEEPVLELSCRK